nr:hypothetical protein [Tanacetum cinerariifolium]
MDKVDPTIATKALAIDFNNFISKLNSGVVDTKSADVVSSGWEDPSIHRVKEGGIIKDRSGGDSGPVGNVPSFAKIVQDKPVKKEVSSRFANTLYGYFIGKRLAFPLVENYVKNTKAYYVGFIQSNMCLSSWGRNTYARAMIEVSADEELKKSLVVAIPVRNGKGHTLATVDIEYEWTSPRCSTCLIFGHVDDNCLKRPKVDAPTKDTDEGFVEGVDNMLNDSDSEEIEELILEGPDINTKTITWASTPTDTSLCHHSVYIRDRPWCILGYFSSTLFLEDSTSSSSSFNISMREFKECVEEIEFRDVQRSGLRFTWSQKPKGKDGLLKKIDRIMANVDFNNVFVGAHAIFKPYRASDHSPSVLNIPTLTKHNPRPFKFFNVVIRNERFKQNPLRKLLYEKGNFHTNVTRLRGDLDRAQICLDADPFNVYLRENEATTVVAFNDSLIMEERFLKQKAKIDWLREEDSNSAYFHKAVKSRISRSRIDVATCADGTTVDNEKVADAFCVSLRAIPWASWQEVKDSLFSMGNDKSPGPNGYTPAFFKESWEIIADDFFAAVNEFFINGKFLKEMNHTIIALIPKIRSPSRVTDCRPISCCNDLFKCISKIIANSIKESLKLLGFLKEVLVGFGFHARMIGWIMECVTTTSFSISINGSLHGFFKGKRGLRQGDPLSPYLFTLVMEILTLMFQRRVRESMVFKYHRYCGELELINLCFADDLFLFAHGDVEFAIMIKDASEEFKNVSGLTPSLPKSTAYFCNVLNHTKLSILNVLPFKEGQLPVKYLGVPLVSSRLILRDCKELIERLQSRVQDWKNKSLSTAGRLQLIKSVIGSMHIYWASVFILPSRVLLDIEQLMRGFFGAKVSCVKVELRSLRRSCVSLRMKVGWDYPLRGNMSWGWRKILQLRPIIHEFIKFKIGDGTTASVWFDKWSEGDPLANTVSSRDIFRAGLDFSTKVRDVILHGAWNWPSYLCDKYLNLSMLVVSNIMENTLDRLVWQNVQGIDKPFSVTHLWSSLRSKTLKSRGLLWCGILIAFRDMLLHYG